MKVNVLVMALWSLSFFACNAQNSSNTNAKLVNNQEMQIMNKAKSQSIQLQKGELFLALVGYQMAGKEALLQEYFGIVFPPAQKHGFTPLGQLLIDEVAVGHFRPNEFVGLFKWPEMASVEKFMGEVSPMKLMELRTQIWSELKQHMIMVTEDFSLTFKEGKVYEVKMLWGDHMIDASKFRKHGGKIVLQSPVAAYEDLGKNKAPSSLLIIEWNNQKSAESFGKMNPLGFDREEAFYTHFAFPE